MRSGASRSTSESLSWPILEAMACRDAISPVITTELGFATRAQRNVGIGMWPAHDDRQLRHEDLADAKVGGRIEGACLGDLGCRRQQVAGRPRPATCCTRHLVGEIGHRRCRGEVALGIEAIAVPGIEGDETPRCIEDVHDACLGGFGIAHGVGKQRSDASLARPVEDTAGHRRRQRPAGRAMRRDLDEELVAEDLTPRGCEGVGEVRSAHRDCGDHR